MRARPLGAGVLGFGWLGQTHSRSLQRIPTLFPDRTSTPSWRSAATRSPPGSRATSAPSASPRPEDWRAAMDHPNVDVV